MNNMEYLCFYCKHEFTGPAGIIYCPKCDLRIAVIRNGKGEVIA